MSPCWGPFCNLHGFAEIHRWRHKREYENAQVNFGERWMLLDNLFGSFHDQKNGVLAGDVGLRPENFPIRCSEELWWPFKQKKPLVDGVTSIKSRLLSDGSRSQTLAPVSAHKPRCLRNKIPNSRKISVSTKCRRFIDRLWFYLTRRTVLLDNSCAGQWRFTSSEI